MKHYLLNNEQLDVLSETSTIIATNTTAIRNSTTDCRWQWEIQLFSKPKSFDALKKVRIETLIKCLTSCENTCFCSSKHSSRNISHDVSYRQIVLSRLILCHLICSGCGFQSHFGCKELEVNMNATWDRLKNWTWYDILMC